MKKAISILFAMLVAGTMSVSPCMAKDNVSFFELSQRNNIVPYNLAITDNTANLNRLGNRIYGSAYAEYNLKYTAQMTVNVQRSTDKVNWLKAGSLGTVNGINGKLSLSGDFPAISGYYYRLAATVTVYDGSTVVESLTFYSPVV